MKIVRFNHSQYNGLGVVDGDDLVIVSDTDDSSLPRNTVELIERWGVLEERINALVDDGGRRLPLSEVTLLSPIDRPGKFLGYWNELQEA